VAVLGLPAEAQILDMPAGGLESPDSETVEGGETSGKVATVEAVVTVEDEVDVVAVEEDVVTVEDEVEEDVVTVEDEVEEDVVTVEDVVILMPPPPPSARVVEVVAVVDVEEAVVEVVVAWDDARVNVWNVSFVMLSNMASDTPSNEALKR
jgi:hypothetical protein